LIAMLSLAACTSASSDSAREGRPGSGTPSAGVSEALPTQTSQPIAAGEPLRLVTLGDAYTAGTDTVAPKRDSWPAQLVVAMDRGDLRLILVDNLADSGQTSQNVLDEQLPQVASLYPDVVTVQVGVNDIIAQEIEDYEGNLSLILDELLRLLPPERVFLITTPDHTLTERGADWGSRDEGHAAVVEANAILRAVASERRVSVIDIGPVNERAAQDASLVIGEGPYPTAKQYAGWVEVIGPQMERVLTGGAP
jgi:lysophospholipase L1-like esterase